MAMMEETNGKEHGQLMNRMTTKWERGVFSVWQGLGVLESVGRADPSCNPNRSYNTLNSLNEGIQGVHRGAL